MNIVLTHGYFLAEDPKEREIMRPYPPLGILYISGYLDMHGIANEVFDSTFATLQKLEHFLLQEKPRMLGIYTNLMTKLNVLKIIAFVKNEPALSNTKIILGGPEVRNHKEKFLAYGADVIVFGEGEDTMVELANAFTSHLRPDLSVIPGIAYKNEIDNVTVNEERILIRDINQLPFPNRKKINMQLYFDAWKPKHGISMVNVSTMRGCPYSCKWCSRAVYGTSYRRRNPKLVVDEMQWLKENYSFDMIWFVDDVFTINPRWLREFAEEISVRNLNIPYEIITRADRLTEESVQLLKQSGCFRVWIGAESGSQKIIDAMDRRVKVEQVRDMIRLVKQYGMEAGTFIMLGYPGEDESDIKETLKHLKYANPSLYTVTVAYPIKGTPLYTEVEDLFIEELAWENSTDRDIDFTRTYSRRYYVHAINWIQQEMLYLRNQGPINKLKLKLRSVKARAGMYFERFRHRIPV
ncbi:B12-binding domain-containing radical SAM protein [Panacibacter sp. DH6]|uniref:B12-binding domain-containing radical SAM protein n=1 Tax=Panacibacter microcysteis TaxID=2793269 RepID=A0A931E8T8_9BACT|nr:radical SAM protein [Panacibacter microcysteis]MBG9377481.1 B12-binding domain-containing radical SAM protein [Panacibacter microcysteis]